MKRNTGLLLVALLAALTLLVSGCGEKQETPDLSLIHISEPTRH